MGLVRRLSALLAVLVLAAAPFAAGADTVADLFVKHRAKGTFVLLDARTGALIVFNEDRAARPLPPASTFKIANSLIALETGVIADENEIIPYGGQPQPMASWEKDMSLRDAVKVSNVPVFQEVARRVGLETYQQWLGTLNYGNG